MEKVTRREIEQSARRYLDEVQALKSSGGNGNGSVSGREYNRALQETIKTKEKIVRAKGGEIID